MSVRYMMIHSLTACGVLDWRGMKNCTDNMGFWCNHTCEMAPIEGMNCTQNASYKDLIQQQKYPSDEYFQYVCL